MPAAASIARQRQRRTDRAGAKDGHSRDHDPDGAGMLPRRRSALARHARHARQHLRQLRRRQLRPGAGPGRAVRRSGDRQGLGVRQPGEGDPRRHRPLGDRKIKQARPADRRRPEAFPAGVEPGGRAAGGGRVAAKGGRVETRGAVPLRRGFRRHPAATRHQRALPADGRPRRDHRHGRGPAPDVDGPTLQVPPAAAVAFQRRAGNDGLRPAGGRRAPRPPSPTDWWSTSTATAAS